MPTDNAALLAKAQITTDAIANAGKLNTKQADKFIDYVVEETAWMNDARIIRVEGDSFEIDKIGVGRRAAVPAAEGKDPGVRRSISTGKVTMRPVEIMIPFAIGDSVLETNIQGASLEDTIVKMMGRKAANDCEELHITGDALGAAALEADLVEGGASNRYIKDSYLGLYDGWLRQADAGHIFNAAGANIGSNVFGSLIRSLPTKFRRDRGKLRWMMSSDLAQLWRERTSARATGIGDAALGGANSVPAFGIPIVEIPLLPLQPRIVEHVTLTGTTAVALRYGPVANVVVTASGLAGIPQAAYVQDTDFVVNEATGAINRTSGGAISSGQLVKVTYDANPQVILSHRDNFIVAISRNIRIEKQRNIFTRMNEYAITMKIAAAIEETDAIAKAINIGTGA